MGNKRIHVRIEHIRKSKCQVEIKTRVKANEAAKKKAKETGQKVNLKRIPAQPKEAYYLEMLVRMALLLPSNLFHLVTWFNIVIKVSWIIIMHVLFVFINNNEFYPSAIHPLFTCCKLSSMLISYTFCK